MTSPDQVAGTAREETSAVAGTAAEESKAVAGTAKDQASAVASTTAQAAADVKDTAVEQAGAVATEAKQQAGNVVSEVRDQVAQQTQAQTQRAASGIRAIADQLRDLAEGRPPQSGPALDLIRSLADRAQSLASTVETQGPQGLLEQVRSFARRRPGGFLAAAALAGAAAGRMVKGATADGSSTSTPDTSYGVPDATYSDMGGVPPYDYGTATGTPLSGLENDSLYVDPTAPATPYSGEYGDPNPTSVDYETDTSYRSGSDAGRI